MSVKKQTSRTRSDVVTPDQLTRYERQRMYAIMADHFVNVTLEAFDRDLSEKDWVIRILDASGEVQGFSTLKLLRHEDERGLYLGFYSGDTVLAPEFMSESQWLGTWARHVFGIAEAHPDHQSFWVLLTATHRTYRFLPGFFKEFHPDPDHPTPINRKGILDAFVVQKFPNEYDRDRGIVRLASPTPYRHADQVEASGGQHNRFNQYFRAINPGYIQSDFLCCLVAIDRSNVTPLGHRVLQPVGKSFEIPEM